MDAATVKELLNYGLATALVLGGAGFVALLIWRSWPFVTEWMTEKTEAERKRGQSYDESVVTWRDVAASAKAAVESEQKQTPIMIDTNQIVRSISDRQIDVDGPVSNVHTIQKLNKLLDNDEASKIIHQKFARAGIEACEGLIEDYPELSSKLKQAINTLQEIERDA